MSNRDLSILGRGSLILSGFLLVLGITVIGLAVQGTTSEIQLFDQFVRPFTLAAAGLGTGHYIGRSFREQQVIHVHIAAGFFIGIFIESILFTIEEGVTIGEAGYLLPYPAIVVITALFALIIHLSPAIPNDEDITEIMNLFGGPATTGFLMLSTVTEFVLSLDLPNDTVWIGTIVVLAVMIVGVWAYSTGVDTGKEIESGSER